jgi:NADH:ubiquinone oxidoreductase subunit
MGFFSYLGVLSPAHITLFNITTRKKKIGSDALGNTYFEAPPRKGKFKGDYTRPRRWVMYNGKPEASSVPPEWHGWLHYQTNVVPNENIGFRRPWQKPHQANVTGTNQAYRPPGHMLEGGKRDKATGDYEAWSPPE